MSDLISRQAAIELAMQYCPDDDGTCSKAGEDIRNLLDELEGLPSAQPERKPYHEVWISALRTRPEQKAGKWIKPTGMMPPEYMGVYRCSECGEIAMRDWKELHHQTLTKYCPNCGAKMLKEGEEHES